MLPLAPTSESRSPIRHMGTRWVGDGRPRFKSQLYTIYLHPLIHEIIGEKKTNMQFGEKITGISTAAAGVTRDVDLDCSSRSIEGRRS